jgi:hypothetical protein
MNTNMETQLPIRPEKLGTLLDQLAGGTFGQEVETEIAHAMQKVGQRGVKAKGKVVITLDLECVLREDGNLFSEGQVNITPDVKTTLPRKARASKAYFVTKEDNPRITRDDPEVVGMRAERERV